MAVLVDRAHEASVIHGLLGSDLSTSTPALVNDDINISDSDGWYSLSLAAKSGDKEGIEFLLSQGADINAAPNSGVYQGQTALVIATCYKHYDIVLMLLAHGACGDLKLPYRHFNVLYEVAARGIEYLVQEIMRVQPSLFQFSHGKTVLKELADIQLGLTADHIEKYSVDYLSRFDGREACMRCLLHYEEALIANACYSEVCIKEHFEIKRALELQKLEVLKLRINATTKSNEHMILSLNKLYVNAEDAPTTFTYTGELKGSLFKDALRINRSLQTLQLGYYSNMMEDLQDIFSVNVTLHSLVFLDGQYFTESAAKKLISLLSRYQTIKTLRFQVEDIHTETVFQPLMFILSCLHETSIESFSIEQGSEVKNCLARLTPESLQSLKNNNVLKSLSLDIGLRDMQILAETLSHNTCLEYLRVVNFDTYQSRHLSDAFGNMLIQNKTLSHFSFRLPLAKDSHMFFKGLSANTSLHTVTIDADNCEVANCLKDALQKNHSIVDIKFHFHRAHDNKAHCICPKEMSSELVEIDLQTAVNAQAHENRKIKSLVVLINNLGILLDNKCDWKTHQEHIDAIFLEAKALYEKSIKNVYVLLGNLFFDTLLDNHHAILAYQLASKEPEYAAEVEEKIGDIKLHPSFKAGSLQGDENILMALPHWLKAQSVLEHQQEKDKALKLTRKIDEKVKFYVTEGQPIEEVGFMFQNIHGDPETLIPLFQMYRKLLSENRKLRAVA